MANRIYRGQITQNCPNTLSINLTEALLPGVFATQAGAAATSGAGRILIVKDRDFYDQDLDKAYEVDELASLYRARPDDEFYVRTTADAYTLEQELTIGSTGLLEAASSNDVVVAFADEAKTTTADEPFLDIVIANAYVKA